MSKSFTNEELAAHVNALRAHVEATMYSAEHAAYVVGMVFASLKLSVHKNDSKRAARDLEVHANRLARDIRRGSIAMVRKQ